MKIKPIDRKLIEWMSKVETLTIQLNPIKAGKIDWDTATYLYTLGTDYKLAAKKLSSL